MELGYCWQRNSGEGEKKMRIGFAIVAKILVGAASALVLAGCAPSLEAANERGGVMPRVIGLNRAEAFATADKHCHQYGRVARISDVNAWNSTMTFDCIDR